MKLILMITRIWSDNIKGEVKINGEAYIAIFDSGTQNFIFILIRKYIRWRY